MELDDFKNTVELWGKSENSKTSAVSDPLQSLIGEMKEKDKQEQKALLYLVIMFGVFVTIYLAQVNRQEGVMKMGYALLTGGFMLSLLYFFLKFRQFKKISYTEPVLSFLKEAERRYAYWPLKEILISIPLAILMGIGGGLIVYSSFNKYFPGSPVPVVIYCLVYFAAFVVGYWAGRKQWEKSKRPLYEMICRMRQEFGA